ncbi:hypothetical protein [Thalassoglobus sp.]|uniref:hypothetical protein n=1 Tax=Thalassoglobus sp. TaxID=2795869 RepID=UPI003AA84899
MEHHVDGVMKKWALIAIIAWAILGIAVLQSPLLLFYILLHACTTGVFLYFFLRKENEAGDVSKKNEG